MKKWKNNLDEAQEQKLLQIEHNAYQFAFWGLIAAIVVQTALSPGALKSIAGEWIVFMIMCTYVIIACLKNGIFDRRFKPTRKTSLVSALIAGAVIGVLWFILVYRVSGSVAGSLASAVFGFLFTFALTYAAMAVSIKLYKKRVKKLDSEIEE